MAPKVSCSTILVPAIGKYNVTAVFEEKGCDSSKIRNVVLSLSQSTHSLILSRLRVLPCCSQTLFQQHCHCDLKTAISELG
ncbi:hypothetical protein P8452_11665 [Trifolium repens]|nr:hypothetical protein P8452_11665 [Trifolium repens]